MKERERGPRTKLDRAKKHVADLEAEIIKFWKRDPYLVVREEDLDTGDEIDRLRVREDPCRHWPAIAGDAVHNLRSALDLLMWQLVEAGGGTPDDKTMFPIAWNKKAFETGGLRRVKGISQDAKRILKGLKPYKGGNDALWRLNRLDANDKHRLLAVVGSAYSNFIIHVEMPSGAKSPPIALRPADRQFPLKDGAELFRVPRDQRGPESHKHPQFSFEIALSDGEVVEGEPVIPTLNDLVRLVEEILDLFAPLL